MKQITFLLIVVLLQFNKVCAVNPVHNTASQMVSDTAIARGVLVPTEGSTGLRYAYQSAVGVKGKPELKGNTITIKLSEKLHGEPVVFATAGVTDDHAQVFIPVITYMLADQDAIQLVIHMQNVNGGQTDMLPEKISFIIYDGF